MVREAELLGVIARGSLSRIGAALQADDGEALAAASRRLLPTATSTARFGADLTAVVTGTPSARLAALLDAVQAAVARATRGGTLYQPRRVLTRVAGQPHLVAQF